jgi:hypothetical protein
MQLLRDFKLDVTPMATGADRLRQDGKPGCGASGKFPASAKAAASSDESHAATQTRYPPKKDCALGGAAQVVQAQLEDARCVPDGSGPELALGLGGG